MSISAKKIEVPVESIRSVKTTDSRLQVFLDDGREISLPLKWYPRLKRATAKQREKYRLIGGRTGIQWPEIDEDLDVEGILGGYPSPEYLKSKTSRRK